jgi:predicted Zn-dependent protease
MDPDLGFVPFGIGGFEVYNPVVWFERGVLKELAYDRRYAIRELGLNRGLLTNGAFRMTGGTISIDEMIQTTSRGLLVTRFSGVEVIDGKSVLCTGYTRDGLWLVENGKISKAVKNFRFTESPLFVFNQVEQLGVPQRVLHPAAPVVVPPAKVRDFSFTALSDSV